MNENAEVFLETIVDQIVTYRKVLLARGIPPMTAEELVLEYHRQMWKYIFSVQTRSIIK